MAFGTKINISKTFFVFIILSIGLVYGQTVWTGGGTVGDWNDAANWDNGTPNSQTATIPAGFTPTITSNIDAAIPTTLTIASTASLTINQSGGTLTTTGLVTASGNLTMTAGDLDILGLTVSGGIVNFGSGAHRITGNDLTISSGTLNAGSSTVQLDFSFSTFSTADFNKTGGTFNAGTSTFRFLSGQGNSVSSNDAVSFYNIDHSPSNNIGLTFNSVTYTISNQFTRGNNSGGTTLTGASISYSPGATLKYDLSVSRSISNEWPTSGSVPNVVLQNGQVTIASGTRTVGTKLTRTNGSIVTTGTLAYSAGATLEYNGGAQTVGNEWTSSLAPTNVIVSNTSLNLGDGSTTLATLTGNLTLTNGAVDYNTTSGSLSIAGNVVGGSGSFGTNNNDVLNVTGASSAVTSSGATSLYDLNISSTGGTVGNITINNSLTVNPGGGGTVTLNSGLTLATDATITVSSGTFDLNGQTITKATGHITTVSNGATLQTGGTSLSGLTLSAASGTIIFDGTSSSENLPTGITVGTVQVNNSNGVSAASGTLTVGTSLTLTNGAVSTSGTNSILIADGASASGGSASSFVDGPLQKEFSGTVSFDFPVGYNPYLPATFEYLSFSSGGGNSIIEIEAVSGDPGGSNPSGISAIATSHHYVVTEAGTAPSSFTYEFAGTYTGTGFAPETRNQLIVQTGSGPTYTYPNTNPQTVTEGSDLVRIEDALSALPTNDGIIAFGAGGAAVAWDGSEGDGLWSNADNWDSGAVPSAADDVTIDLSGGATVTIDADVAATAQSLTLGNGADNAIILVINTTNANPLDVTNALTLNSEATLRFVSAGGGISAGSTSYDAASTVEYQSSTIPVDTYGNLFINGATGISGTAGTVTVAGNLTKDGGSFTASGSYPISVTGTYTNTAGNSTYTGGLTVNGATFTITSGTIGGTVTLAGSSAQSLSGGGSTIQNLTINNSNGVTFTSSVLVSGALTFSAGLVITTYSNLLTIGTSGSIYGKWKF